MASVASAAVQSAVAGIDAAAGALVRAGVALAGGASSDTPVSPLSEEPSAIVLKLRDGEGWREERRVPGAGVPFRDVLLVKERRVQGPEMVVLPAGEFMMGSPPDEERWNGYKGEEEPQHRVRIATPFAVGRFAVTRGEFRAFVQATNHPMPDEAWTFEKEGFFGSPEAKLRKGRGWLNPGYRQDDQHPVVCVSWDDARAYVKWLNTLVIGNEAAPYRLPSEAEWEYACRGTSKLLGTATTPFWWGRSISTSQANYDGNFTYSGGKKGKYWQRTLRVESFQPNPWGLYQVHGNVWEWCQDNWHPDYNGAPVEGSVWAGGEHGSRVLRGGSWLNNPRNLRAAQRDDNTPDDRDSGLGFRVARTLIHTP